MYKGLILSMDKNTVLVATPDNAFYKLKRQSTMYVGKEIEFTTKDIINNVSIIKKISAVAACLCLIFGLTALYFISLGYREFAYVSLDINPGIEFTIDETQKVLKVKSLNDEAKDILKSKNVKGIKVKYAISEVIDICKEKGIITEKDKTYFLISGSLNPRNKEYKQDKSGMEDSLDYILDNLRGTLNKVDGNKWETIVLKAEPEDRLGAIEENLSQGKFVLYNKLKRKGSQITVSEVQKSKVEELIRIFTGLDPASSSDLGLLDQSALNGDEITGTTSTPAASNQGSTSGDQTTSSDGGTSPIAEGTGLRGEYFDNIDLTNSKLIRVDETIDFSWATDPPVPEIRNDESYSIRWTGKIRPEYSEEYTFYVFRDNGVRLWVDNKLIIDKWDNEWDVTDTGTIFLESGKLYDIKLEYFNNTGYGIIKLEWSSKSTEKTVVPEKSLYPGEVKSTGQTGMGNGTGLKFEYYDNENLTNLKLTGIDSNINFDWGVGSPDKSIEQDCKFSIRWKGFVQPAYSEEYIFYITQDDGTRLWIDGKLIMDKWHGSEGKEVQSDKIFLEAGKKHKIVLEYHNNSLAGKVKLEWSSPSTERTVIPQKCLYPE